MHGRRREPTSASARYRARNDHPDFYAFRRDGAAEDFFTDAQGREYRRGPLLESGLRRYYVRLPDRTVPWFDMTTDADAEFVLRSAVDTESFTRVRLAAAFIADAHRHRTGHINVYEGTSPS
jgi:hypothetical protein